MKRKCAVHNTGDSWTCFRHESLVHLIDSYNALAKPAVPLSKSGSKRQLWERIFSALSHKCKMGDEACATSVLRSSEAEKDLSPKAPYYWEIQGFAATSTTTITDALERYETHYPHFKYLGTFPLDFQHIDNFGKCIGKFMCSFRIDSLAKEKKSFGMVINTDPDHKNGEHWVAVFCDTDPTRPSYGINYYDSYGRKPPKLVKMFVDSIVEQMVKLAGKKFPYRTNTKRHQTLSQNCGVFCIRMIMQCASGKGFRDYCNDKTLDDVSIEMFRREFFR